MAGMTRDVHTLPVIPAKAGIHLHSGKIKVGPSFRWDDGLVELITP
jgi:hypothetical protein